MFTRNSKILLGAFVVLFLGGAIFFREEIGGLLYFGDEVKTEMVGLRPVNQPSAESPMANDGSESPPSASMGRDDTGAKAPVAPPYKGRDPEEIRSVPEEIKLFSADQLHRLYNALTEHGRAVKTNPFHFNGWIQLGLLKKTIGDFEGARDAWEYAGVIEPLNSLSFANLGELYWRYLHDYLRSEANLKISIKHKSDDLQTYVTLAELYHYSLKEKYDLASQVLLDGLKSNPGDETLTRRLAALYEQRKEYTKSLEWWNKVLEMAPGDAAVLEKIEGLKNK